MRGDVTGWAETLFALGNGYLGIRGVHDEGFPVHAAGTFVNGFHETWPIVYPETAFGLARTGQTIVNVPDGTVLAVEVDGEPVSVLHPRLGGYERRLDFRAGILGRRLAATTTGGTRVELRSRRLVSLDVPHLAAVHLQVSVDRPARVEVTSLVVNRQDTEGQGRAPDDPRRGRVFDHRVLEPVEARRAGTRRVQGWVTATSRLGLVVGCEHLVDPPAEVQPLDDPDRWGVIVTAHVAPGHPLTVTKLLAYHADPSRFRAQNTTSRPASARENGIGVDDLLAAADVTLAAATTAGFEALAARQRALLDEFWAAADVEIEPDGRLQQAARWSLLQLHHASALTGAAGIPAKGLTGQAYDGHYFWDTDVYVLPFLALTRPAGAIGLIRFRHAMLDAARARAAEMSQRGALFPWRTINGEEASAYFPAGTAQYHIDADVTHGVRTVWEVSGDDGILWEAGVEIAIETARLWEDLGFYGRDGRFHIHQVTGPDEYTALVDDNAFTNAMARMNLRVAAEWCERMGADRPDGFRALAARLDLDPDEPARWRRAAEAMVVPEDSERGITLQDAHFLERKPWDFARVPEDRYPLLLHFHPLVIYRHQVLKQADVVLADFLLGDEFPADRKRADFSFYDPLTTADSSLSAAVQAIMAAEVGDQVSALRHFEHAAAVDLADAAGNTADGVHLAAAGGLWMGLVYGFGGFRHHRGRFTLDPHLPGGWDRLRFRLRLHGVPAVIDLTQEAVAVAVEGGELALSIRGEPVVVRPGPPAVIRL